jgi:hypothetical protein
MAKHFRHQVTKMNINQKVSRFPLCLGAFVAIFSGLSGLGIMAIIVVDTRFSTLDSRLHSDKSETDS